MGLNEPNNKPVFLFCFKAILFSVHAEKLVYFCLYQHFPFAQVPKAMDQPIANIIKAYTTLYFCLILSGNKQMLHFQGNLFKKVVIHLPAPLWQVKPRNDFIMKYQTQGVNA